MRKTSPRSQQFYLSQMIARECGKLKAEDGLKRFLGFDKSSFQINIWYDLNKT
ncbi:hypothetical protein [Nostoc sp. DedSLP03]|uniref:hypothetical protein n=1 Tax=Nostoc sp. DedSLP03 TaxID=3075400 RepID=UPI002AD1EC11|nr:hypothetical protein [Nostoc sp. DedSLP03]